MTMVMSELKKKKMFYLDSVTTHRSVCPKSQGCRYPFCKARDVFLVFRNRLWKGSGYARL
jgi:polysaccharide deacetylase 2 family uncharacterized protein YibQ